MSSGILETSGLQASALLLAVSEFSRVLRHQTRDVPYFRWLGVVSAGHPPFLIVSWERFGPEFREPACERQAHLWSGWSRTMSLPRATQAHCNAFKCACASSPAEIGRGTGAGGNKAVNRTGWVGVRDELLSRIFCGKIKPTTTNCWLAGVRRASPTIALAREERSAPPSSGWAHPDTAVLYTSPRWSVAAGLGVLQPRSHNCSDCRCHFRRFLTVVSIEDEVSRTLDS